MNETNITNPIPLNHPALRVDYLLRELEFQIAIEVKARERVESMAQNLLTTIAAVFGAVLLINEVQDYEIQLWLLGSILLFTFTSAWFSRFCRLRYITTYSRVNRYKIRAALSQLGIREADQLIEWEGNPSGFGRRMLAEGWSLLGLSSFFGGASAVLALMIVYQLEQWPLRVTSSEWSTLIIVPLLVMAIIAIVLRAALIKQKSRSDQLITHPEWLDLENYDI